MPHSLLLDGRPLRRSRGLGLLRERLKVVRTIAQPCAHCCAVDPRCGYVAHIARLESCICKVALGHPKFITSLTFPQAASMAAGVPAILKPSTYTGETTFNSRCRKQHSHPGMPSKPMDRNVFRQCCYKKAPDSGRPCKARRRRQT